MKEFCGFKSLDGSLHETFESAQEADYKFKIKEIKNKFDSIESFIEERLHNTYFIKRDSYVSKKYIQDIVIEIFSDKFRVIELYRQGEECKAELDKLKEKYDKSERAKYSTPWYLKLKWW